MVHRVYICSNLKSSFILQKYDQLEGCDCYNLVMASSSSFVLKKQAKFQEEDHYWLLPTTYPPTKLKPTTVCYQEGEDDEDMAPMDTPMKVKDKVSSFLYLYNDKTKNLLLPNIGISNVLRNDGDDDRVWICHVQDRSWSASSSKSNIRFIGSPTVLHCKGHNSSI
jgi:hypothetical protein